MRAATDPAEAACSDWTEGRQQKTVLFWFGTIEMSSVNRELLFTTNFLEVIDSDQMILMSHVQVSWIIKQLYLK